MFLQETDVLGVVILSLSSNCELLRAAAYETMALFFEKIKVAKFFCDAQVREQHLSALWRFLLIIIAAHHADGGFQERDHTGKPADFDGDVHIYSSSGAHHAAT